MPFWKGGWKSAGEDLHLIPIEIEGTAELPFHQGFDLGIQVGKDAIGIGFQNFGFLTAVTCQFFGNEHR